MQITVPQTDVYTSLTLESTAAWFAGKAELSLADGTMTATQSLKNCTVALDNISVSSGSVLTVWFATLPTSALNGGSLTVKLSGKNTAGSTTVTGLNAFEAGKAYSFSCSASSPSAGGMEYVDLGLSVKWAKCNLGASNPEEYGDYYAWGEIETYYEDGYAQEAPQNHWKNGNPYYSSNTSKYYKFWQDDTVKVWVDEVIDADGFVITPGGEKTIIYYGFSKYVMPKDSINWGFKGVYDNLTTLQACDDVAHIKLGGKWRIPTADEFTELLNNCTWQWATYRGINGYKVTSNKAGYTDKWIFLPAADHLADRFEELSDLGYSGYYWSSSLATNQSRYARYMGFGKYTHQMYYELRYYSKSIRPVSD